eukprot:13668989-Alexandrium_andersonii.AAC.1
MTTICSDQTHALCTVWQEGCHLTQQTFATVQRQAALRGNLLQKRQHQDRAAASAVAEVS